MSTPLPPEVAGVSLQAPRLLYEVQGPFHAATVPPTPPPESLCAAALTRPHVGRTLEGATLTVRSPESELPATFALAPFLSPAVLSYLPSPGAAWRALLVDQRLLSRPELLWTGALPEGWALGLEAPWAEAIAAALAALHARYRSLVEERYSFYQLRSLECAECLEARAAKLPPDLPPWQRQMRLSPAPRCPHAVAAMHAMGALCQAHPELTFELLGWLEPAGARLDAAGPEVTRFALTGPLMDTLLGPWLVGEAPGLASRTSYRGYEGSRLHAWRRPSDTRPLLPRALHNGVSLAASAWGFTGDTEALVEGDPSAEEPGLDRTAAPPIETAAVLPREAKPRSSG